MHYKRLVKHGSTGPAGSTRFLSPAAKLAKYVNKASDPNGCWLWTGGTNDSGYGRVAVGGKDRLAHRVAYEETVGAIPKGYEIDHLCRVITCINPAHLEAVTGSENLSRMVAAWREPGGRWGHTTCNNGHELTGNNVLVRPSRPTHRACRACERDQRIARRANQQRKREAGAPPTPLASPDDCHRR